MRIFFVAICWGLSAFCAPALSQTQEIRIVSWNMREVFESSDVASRTHDFSAFGGEMRPDVLMLQEFTDCDLLDDIRDAMGLAGYHMACSDFVQSDSPRHASFELAILSRFELDEVIEFDPSADRRDADEPTEVQIDTVVPFGFEDAGTSRGFLWARIDALDLTVAVVHLKSSVGRSGEYDADNAAKRERISAALVAYLASYSEEHPNYTNLVGGDFNVGHGDSRKNGNNPMVDCFDDECGTVDRYDETHAIYSAGLVQGMTMLNLMGHYTGSTYPSYPGTPIDNLYVAGPAVGDFRAGTVGLSLYGSDHLPIATVMLSE